MDTKALGEQMRRARKDRGLTSDSLSELCSVNSTYIRQLEAGMKTPSLPIFISICNNLRVSPTYLLAAELDGCDSFGIDALFELCKNATPKQLKMISSIVKSALDALEE